MPEVLVKNSKPFIIFGKPFIIFGKPDIGSLEEEAVLSVLRSGWLGNGQVADELENKFSSHLVKNGAKSAHCVAVNSCTTGLYLSLKAEGIGVGHEVITTPLTFAATVNAILATGAKPVFVDTFEDGSMNVNQAIKAINKNTKAIIPVHLWGNPVQMKPLLDLAYQFKLAVIEDSAHGFGGFYLNRPLGTWGDYGVFSFYPTKNIGSGDGGMVVTNDPDKAQLIRIMASQGVSKRAWDRNNKNLAAKVNFVGFKGLINDLEASIALAQLKRWPVLWEKRCSIWNIYQRHFGKEVYGHSKHLFTIEVNNRDNLREKLFNEGIGTGIHYKPLHLEAAYKDFGKVGQFPIAETIGARTMSLPLSTTMTLEDTERVIEIIKREILWN